jgi:hypothetical protein
VAWSNNNALGSMLWFSQRRFTDGQQCETNQFWKTPIITYAILFDSHITGRLDFKLPVIAYGV